MYSYLKEKVQTQLAVDEGRFPHRIPVDNPRLARRAIVKFLRRIGRLDIGTQTDNNSVWLRKYKND